MSELPKFRYLDEAVRMVKQIDEMLNDSEQLIKKQQKLLAYLQKPQDWIVTGLNKKTVTSGLQLFSPSKIKADVTTFDITPSSPADRKRAFNKLRQVVDPKLTKVVVPNLSKLKSQYKIIEDLYEQYRNLESIETQIGMQFEHNRDLKSAQDQIRRVKRKVEQQMKEVFAYLNKVAEAHVPQEFQEYVGAINNEIGEHVLFESSSQFLYVNISDKGSIVFTNYTMLVNAVNEDGEIAPHMYVSIQWILGNPKGGEEPSIRVSLDHDFELPAKLIQSPGVDVASAQDAVRAIANLLDLENFSSSLGVIPLSLKLKIDPNSLKSGMFSYRDYISKVAVDSESNSLIFELKTNMGVDRASATKVAQQLFLEVRQIVKKSKGTKILASIDQKGKRFIISFRIMGKLEGTSFNAFDAEFLKDKFGLSDLQLRKIVQILNQGA